MAIKAKCNYNKESIKALTYVSIYKKSNPKKTFLTRTIICFVPLLVIVGELFAFGFDIFPLFLMILDVLIILIDFFYYFAFPAIQYNSLARMKCAENDYIFCDNTMKIFTKSNEYSGEAEVEYSLFVKVYETSKYFFIYQTNNQAFIIDKQTVEGGTPGDIRSKLLGFVKNRYVICRY